MQRIKTIVFFSILVKALNDYHLGVLESLFIKKRFRPMLCKQQHVYKFNLFKLLYMSLIAYFILLIACFTFIFVRMLVLAKLLFNS